jgi:hypothetical protein
MSSVSADRRVIELAFENEADVAAAERDRVAVVAREAL